MGRAITFLGIQVSFPGPGNDMTRSIDLTDLENGPGRSGLMILWNRSGCRARSWNRWPRGFRFRKLLFLGDSAAHRRSRFSGNSTRRPTKAKYLALPRNAYIGGQGSPDQSPLGMCPRDLTPRR